MQAFLFFVVSIIVGVLATRIIGRKKEKRWGARIGGVVVGFVCLIVLVGAFAPQEPTPASHEQAVASTPTPAPKADKPKEEQKPAEPPAYKTTVDQLERDYKANEVATDNKMKGKIIEVSGRLKAIDKDFLGNVVLKFPTRNPYLSASMTLNDSEAGKAAKLKKGQYVTLRCGSMARIMQSPAGSDCKLVD